MADLVAQGPQLRQRWRKRLPLSGAVVVGRTGTWSVPWDEHISRRHAHLHWSAGKLTVLKLPEARNPLFYCGAACDQCTLGPGQHFVIGSTTFSLLEEQVTIDADARVPAIEHTFTLDDLQRSAFRESAKRLEVLSRLPEVIGGEDDELCAKLVELLLSGISHATFAAVVHFHEMPGGATTADVVHWDQRGEPSQPVRPSERLIRESMRSSTSMAHVWSDSEGEAKYTQAAAVTWAVCTPIRHAANRGWCVYIAGKEGSTESVHDFAALQDDVKFTELVADTIGRLRELRRLERRQAALAQFVSPVVLDRVELDGPTEAFAPCESDVSVLFCDLRGFSRAAERSAHDLMSLLERVSRALGVMTRHILDTGGVVGDFHGDAAMGFWGWPLEQSDRVLRACTAALSISQEFANAAIQAGNPLADFSIGIGIATGRAVAGKIGTTDQVKITVFGPVVNLAARLQELTKILRAPILIDEVTADGVRTRADRNFARVRQIARLRPRGLESPLMVSQLLPPSGRSLITDAHIATYEQALSAFLAGDFENAFSLLHLIPAEDRVKDFLTVFIAQNHRKAPVNWNGVVDPERS